MRLHLFKNDAFYSLSLKADSDNLERYAPYLKYLAVVRSVFKKELNQGNLRGTYVKMSTFMDRLKHKAGAMGREAAKSI